MKENDERRTCSESKKSKIKASMQNTRARRLSQACKVFECKIVEKRLNKRQREELQMLFVEGKWFYNHILNLHKNVSLTRINTTDIKQVERLDKDKNKISQDLEYLSAAQKQAIVARMISNEKTILTLVKKGI